jgi:hypothetical protein
MKAKFLFWIPRIFTILAILFMFIFSLDAFSGDETFGKKMLGFLMHNIPVLLLIGVLIIAWKWEVIGGIIFIIASVAGCVFFRAFAGNPAALAVMLPFFSVGILFILGNILNGKNKTGIE